MREIKFRAWHTQIGAMFFAGDNYGTVHPLDCCNYLRQGQPVELMQYTGLKDKNGAEIYEGDVVKGSLSFEGGTLPTMGAVEFCQTFSAFGLKNDAGLTLFHNHVTHSFEVIGNIYENPELLEAAA